MTGRSWLTRAAQVRRTTRIAAAVTLLLVAPFAWNLAMAPWTGRLAAQGTRQAGPTDRPDDTRFSVVTVVPMGELDEPLTFAVANDGRVFINERRTGHIKVYNPRGNTTTIVGTIPVNHTYTSAAGVPREAEEGFLGLTLDPNFDTNKWMYVMYADPDVAKHVVARVTLRDETNANGEPITRIVPDSFKTVLEYGTQREACCHTGGGMAWDEDGNLYITVGNNTGNTNTSQTDERPGRANWDDQRGASNSNDLRGKVLRIRPQPDGTYTIPPGNLFPPGTPHTRPEIYAMGTRNAWRVSVDSQTGWVYWGEVGPDNRVDDPNVGPRGYDEFNQARKPGYFGWPYFVGPNAAFPFYDYVQDKPLAPKDPQRPMNTSVNNTGIKELPPAQMPLVYYEYGPSERFPEVGTGGRCAVGGPVYRRADLPTDAPRPWPAYFEGKWIVTECSRAWIMAITMDANGDYQSMERLLPGQRFSEPMDMKFGPEGDLYLLDYGSRWFTKSDDARLVRIEYNGGNRAPLVTATASRLGGSVPFDVQLSSAGTVDYDGDRLQYEWQLRGPDGSSRTLRGASPKTRLDRPGVYTATLTARDPGGLENSAEVEIVAGNETPSVTLSVTGGLNESFFAADTPLAYSVKVRDREDGDVPADRVVVTADYVGEGFDVDAVRQGQQPVDHTTRFAVAKALVAKNSCNVCHAPTGTSIGPSLPMLRERYRDDEATLTMLAGKVRGGSTGVWGTATMPSHPLMSSRDAQTIVEYFLRSGDESTVASLPLTGTYAPTVPAGDTGRGAVVVRAVYSDKGAGALPPRTGEAVRVLRSPRLGVLQANATENADVSIARGSGLASAAVKHNGYLAYRGVDLTNIRQAHVVATAGGRSGAIGGLVELRLGSPAGQVIGQVEVPVSAMPGPPGSAASTSAAGAQGQAQVAQAVARREMGAVARAAAEGFPESDVNTAPRANAGPGGSGGGGAAATTAAAAAARGGPPVPAGLPVALTPVTGTHDLFVVFRNPTAGAAEPVATVTQITLGR
jgi:cytochrome c